MTIDSKPTQTQAQPQHTQTAPQAQGPNDGKRERKVNGRLALYRAKAKLDDAIALLGPYPALREAVARARKVVFDHWVSLESKVKP